jgi:hypothetical protein
LKYVSYHATINGSKSSSATTPNSRGRNKGNISKSSPTKSISSPTQSDKDNEGSDSPVKEGPKIIRLQSNSVTEVLKSTSTTSANLSPSNKDDVASKTNSTPTESNKRKTAPVTPTNNTNIESPVSGGGESRSKRQRKEKKIFDL